MAEVTATTFNGVAWYPGVTTTAGTNSVAHVTSVLSDGSDSTYAYSTVNNFGEAWPTVICWPGLNNNQIPNEGRVLRYQPYIRAAYVGPANALAQLATIELHMEDGANSTMKTQHWTGLDGTIRTIRGASFITEFRDNPTNPWLTRNLNANPQPYVVVKWPSQYTRIYEVGIIVAYYSKPSIGISSVRADSVGDSNPLVTISYAQAEGKLKTAHQVRVFDSAGRQVGVFKQNPTDEELALARQRGAVGVLDTMNSDALSFRLGQALTAGNYTVQVRAGYSWDGYGEKIIWSDWASKNVTVTPFINVSPVSTGFTVQMEALAKPTISSVTWDTDAQANVLTVMPHENILTLNQASVLHSDWGYYKLNNISQLKASAEQALSGSKSWKATPTSSGNMSFEFASDEPVPAGNGSNYFFKVHPGQSYTVGASFRSASTGRSCRIKVEFHNGSLAPSASLVSTQTSSSVTDSSSGWGSVTHVFSAPSSGYSYVKVIPEVLSANEAHYVDNIFLARTADYGNDWTRGGFGYALPHNAIPYTRANNEYTFNQSLWSFTNCTGTIEATAFSNEDTGQALALTNSGAGVTMIARYLEPVPLPQSDYWGFAGHLRSSSTTRNVDVYAYIYDENDVLLGTEVGGYESTNVELKQSPLVVDTSTYPTGSYALLEFRVNSASEKHWLDALVVDNALGIVPVSGNRFIDSLNDSGAPDAYSYLNDQDLNQYRIEVQFSDDDGETWESFTYKVPCWPNLSDPSVQFFDYLAKTGRQYRVRSYAVLDDVVNVSDWSDVSTGPTVTPTKLVVALQGRDESYAWFPTYHTPNRNYSVGRESSTRLMVGRTRPTAEYGEADNKSVSFEVKSDDDPTDTIRIYATSDDEVVYRDNRNLGMAGFISKWNVKDQVWGYVAQLTFREASR